MRQRTRRTDGSARKGVASAWRAVGAAALAGFLAHFSVSTVPARAEAQLRFMTNWFAQAEHGGFYQAQALGFYAEEGVSVEIIMGGPQINGTQLLLAGEADVLMGEDFALYKARERGFDIIAIATTFQYSPLGLLMRPDVPDLSAIGDRTILVATEDRLTWWPWLKGKYGYEDAQTEPYTFNLQPFFFGDQVVVQGYVSSEPFVAEKEGVDAQFHLFAQDGYPPYSQTLIVTRAFYEANRPALEAFVRASMRGWVSYFEDPTPANALIQAANPEMSDAQLAYGLEKMLEHGLVTGGEAATLGVGVITAERYRATHRFMVEAGLLDPSVAADAAYTTEIVDGLDIRP